MLPRVRTPSLNNRRWADASVRRSPSLGADPLRSTSLEGTTRRELAHGCDVTNIGNHYRRPRALRDRTDGTRPPPLRLPNRPDDLMTENGSMIRSSQKLSILAAGALTLLLCSPGNVRAEPLTPGLGSPQWTTYVDDAGTRVDYPENIFPVDDGPAPRGSDVSSAHRTVAL
ncbi:MAG: hypothetical protein R3D62_16620 [Xanthobacteraceae bacterium]